MDGFVRLVNDVVGLVLVLQVGVVIPVTSQGKKSAAQGYTIGLQRTLLRSCQAVAVGSVRSVQMLSLGLVRLLHTVGPVFSHG